jgi:hypothetical protein
MKPYEFTKFYEMFAQVEKYIPNGINFPRALDVIDAAFQSTAEKYA